MKTPLSFANPVWPEDFADPFVLGCTDGYYAFATARSKNGREPDGRIYPVLFSPDLQTWEYRGGAVTPCAATENLALFWAPEVAEKDGRYYMYYGCGDNGWDNRLRVAVAEHPTGPYTDAGHWFLPEEPFSIDASPFQDPKDGRWYLYFAKDFLDGPRPGTGIAVVPLSDDLLHPAALPIPAIRATADWQLSFRDRPLYNRIFPEWYTVEGPFIVVHQNRYWCLYSGSNYGTAEYGVSYAVADHPLGPFVEPDAAAGPTVLRTIPGKVIGPGHCAVTTGPDGDFYLAYHAWDTAHTARRMCLDRLIWENNAPICHPTTNETEEPSR